jgi:hypothetical protein
MRPLLNHPEPARSRVGVGQMPAAVGRCSPTAYAALTSGVLALSMALR